MADALIEARGLTKHFGDFAAVDGIDFTVYRGEAFGFLGPNGAGKSSTMRMIGAVSPVTEGKLTVLGMDPDTDGAKIRARLGVVPQEDNLDTQLPVEENLIVYGRYFDLPRKVIRERIEELLAFAQLTERRKEIVDRLSGGMKRRLTIARSLINEPELILLDEPTTGLDPQARHALWDRLYRLKQQGATLIITTHYMDEAEQLCDRLVVMDKGKIVAEGSPRELIDRYSPREVVELRFPVGVQETVVEDLETLVQRVEALPDRALLYTDDGDRTVADVHALGVVPESMVVRRSTLEDVFLRLTGRSLVDRGGTGALETVDYLTYLAPGLLAATAMQTGAGDSAWPVMAGIKWVKTYDAMLATPVGVRDLALGHLGWVGVRLAMVSGVYAMVMMLFGAVDVLWGAVAVLPAVLTGLAFAAPVTAFTAGLDNDMHLASLFRFGIVPMFLFSGTFFPISQLPDWMEPLAVVTPLWHGVELTRGIALRQATEWAPALHVAYLAALTVLGTWLAVRRLRERLLK